MAEVCPRGPAIPRRESEGEVSDRCKSCRKLLVEHDGLQPTCRKLGRARVALQIIKTWATFRTGESLVPAHVAKLCKKTLEEIK